MAAIWPWLPCPHKVAPSAPPNTQALSPEALPAALAIEMGFLGLTFSTTVKASKPGRLVWFASILLPPVVLIAGGMAGAAAASALEDNPAMHTGLISFGIAALLYLVTEELLLEAHSSMPNEEHVWWIDLMFFIGFLTSFLLEKLTSS